MQLQITLDRDSTAEDALRAIRTIEEAFSLNRRAHTQTLELRVDASEFAKECEKIAGELARNRPGQICTDPNPAATFEDMVRSELGDLAPSLTGAVIFTDAELAADAVPAPPAFNVARENEANAVFVSPEVDPATLGFGGPAPVPAPPTLHAPADLTGATSVPPPPTAAQSGVPLDSSGLPHDPRIHAATRTTMKDGTWKKKPRVTDEEVAAVTAELRGVMGIPAPAAAPAYVVGPSTTEVLGHQVTTNFAPPAPVVPSPPVPAVAGTPSSFPEFIAWVSPLVTSGKLTVLNVNAAALGLGLVNGSGVGSIQLLANRPDLVPAAYAALSAQVAQ